MATDFPVSLGSATPARFLAADEGSAVTAWVGAAIAVVGMLVAACTIGTAAFLYQRHRSRGVHQDRQMDVQKVKAKTAPGVRSVGEKSQAWPDPELGVEQNDALLDKASPAPDKLPASVKIELAEVMRGILEDEISRGLKASGISDRLDRLEQQAKEQQVLSSANLPPPPGKCANQLIPVEATSCDLDSTAKMQQGQAMLPSDLAATVKAQAYVPKINAETSTVPRPSRDASTITEAVSTGSHIASRPPPRDSAVPYWLDRSLILSPSNRQKRYEDPPEKGWMPIDEDRSVRMSMVTVQRNLQKRDVQTQELHRQLRQTQQDNHNQKLEAAYATKKLQDLLADPSSAPQAQAEEVKVLRHQVEDISGKLADAKQSEMQWSITAKRQRAFFMQSERVAQEGVNLFRKHPAGELFLAPPPVVLDDDVEEDPRRAPWDVGNSHINPYVNDSWPFEPNSSYQRCAVEPNLGRWDEEDGFVDSDTEDGSPTSPDSPGSGEDHDRSQLNLRLPQLPPQSPPHGEDFDPPSPNDVPPDGLPALGPLSARSL